MRGGVSVPRRLQDSFGRRLNRISTAKPSSYLWLLSLQALSRSYFLMTRRSPSTKEQWNQKQNCFDLDPETPLV